MSTRNTIAVGVDVVERADHQPAEAVEILAIGNDPRTGGLAFFAVDEHQVDVGRDVEFASAELAHADDDQCLLRPGFGIAGCAVPGGERCRMDAHRGGERQVGQRGHRRADLLERRASGQVAQQRVQEQPSPGFAQQAAQGLGVGGCVDGGLRLPPGEGRVEAVLDVLRQRRVRKRQLTGVAAEGKGSAGFHVGLPRGSGLRTPSGTRRPFGYNRRMGAFIMPAARRAPPPMRVS